MCLNMNDKKYLADQILPEVDFNVNSTGVTIQAGERFTVARFIPFDRPIKCECGSDKAHQVEMDLVIEQKGVTVISNRLRKRQFVAFDVQRDLPGFCFFKIRNKGRVFNIKHDFSTLTTEANPTVKQQSNEVQEKYQNQDHRMEEAVPPNVVAQITVNDLAKEQQLPIENPDEREINNFYGSLSAATFGLPYPEKSNPLKRKIDEPKIMNPPSWSQMNMFETSPPKDASVEFIESMRAATIGFPTEVKVKEEAENHEETLAIQSINPSV